MTENHIGYTLYASAALPATNDAAGFEALTWTQVNGLIEGPQFSYEHDQIAIPDLTTGFEDSVKGMGRGTDTSLMCRVIDLLSEDAGQAIIRTAAIDNDGVISLKLGRGTGTDNALTTGDYVEYCQGYAHSYAPNKPTPTSYEGFQANFRGTKEPVQDTEPA